MKFPWNMFSLVEPGISDEEIHIRLEKLLQCFRMCSQCCDLGFSAQLLNYLSAPMSTEEGRRRLSQTRALLSDMACFMDLSSETAEVLHAQNRSSFIHVGGRYKDAQRCQEQSYINSINDEYLRICAVINSETMPKKRSEGQIRRMLKEQVTGPSSCIQRKRKSFERKVSAWNLFLRHHMEGLTLSKVEWKKKQRT